MPGFARRGTYGVHDTDFFRVAPECRPKRLPQDACTRRTALDTLHFNGQTWTRVQGTSARRAATAMFRNWFSHSFPRTLVVLACAAAIAAARGTVRDWAFLGAATAHVAAASAAAVRGAALPGGAHAAAMAAVAAGVLIGSGVDAAWTHVPWDAQVCVCMHLCPRDDEFHMTRRAHARECPRAGARAPGPRGLPLRV